MAELHFSRGPRLTFIAKNPSSGAPAATWDVTGKAVSYLNETIVLGDDLTLGDIFKILRRIPALVEIFNDYYAKELLEESEKPVRDHQIAKDIEYLELTQLWFYDSLTKTLNGSKHLQLRGVGVPLAEDCELGPAGTRLNWNLPFTPAHVLLSLPLRLNPEVAFMEDNLFSTQYGQVTNRLAHPEITLAQLIHAVLRQLTLLGSPCTRDARALELNADSKSAAPPVDAAARTTIDYGALDVWRYNKLALKEAILNYGGIALGAVWDAVSTAPDHVAIQISLHRLLSPRVMLQEEFRTLTGIQFRSALHDRAQELEVTGEYTPEPECTT